MKNMGKMLKQAQKLQANMMRLQEELAERTVETSAGGGVVKAVANGKQQILSLTIAPEAVDPDDVEMLEDLIVAAHANAQEQLKAASDSTFGAITGGLNLPGV